MSERPRVRPDPALGLRSGWPTRTPRRGADRSAARGRVADGWQIAGAHPPAGMHGGASRPGITPVYQVDDLDSTLAAVREHGGQPGEPQQQPYGRIAECVDDQGARFDLLQPSPH